ncbi:SusC/RagA family TonB-linked outer membrane protein [Seonamhaeicola maritimus]|uniref:SusC/RagA family TonB-linked outer membrane protein n=1 Tax=Seonamhaeicola maritimus TaxID=2591822 RepID=A0A5C7GNM4_9FLAO|nr:SusC/RagA family TonB-linked outer membrane protein [Seonamhaeicola maritimus]TXG39571.1 SusC/RagA family TonB-linked outer membrane protein [Seonamhaeicola maritimus]
MKNNYKTKGRSLLFYIFCFSFSSLFTNALTTTHDWHRTGWEYICDQQPEVHGTITDLSGMPLAGVHVVVQATKQGVVSNINGSYTTKANPNDTLIFSALGFITQTIAINNASEINVRLQEDVTQLDAVTLNAGYYTVKDKERTGSIAKISAKTIEKQPVNNPLSAMQGHLTGVNIVQQTGVPGGGYSIEIRGKNFINGSTNPLYIIDGVPYGGQSLGAVEVSGQINGGNINPLNAMDPTSIESIEVLKDADATAIYGSRAANGVVLVTTKKGKAGKTQVKVNLSSTLGRVSHFLDLMNTEQYLETRREGVTNDGFGAFLDMPAFDFIWPDIKTWDSNRNINWQKELIGGTAYRNHGQLSISGGNEQTQFLISGGHQKETTVFPGDSKYKKTAIHSSLNHQSLDKRFKINLSTNYTVEHNKLPRTDFTSMAYRLEPNAPELYDEAGNLNWENNTWDNPLSSLKEDYQANINTLMANAGVSYKFLPNLQFKTNLGYNNYGLESYRTLPSSARNPSFGFTPENYSSITTNSSKRTSWIVEPQLHWESKFGDATLNILVGTTFQQQSTTQLVQKATGFPNNSLIQNLSAATTHEVRQDSDSEYNYHALFGRIHVNWKDKYFLNVTGRRDGSSRFGSGKQFGNFGAVGVAWVFSEEDFLNDSNILSFGKLRGSYGTTGSDNIGDYRFLDTYSVTGSDYNGTTILEPTGIFNPLFGWESNKKLEVALELGFLKDRIRLNTAWYKNQSSNQLIGMPLAATTGFSELTTNLKATVENRGFEIELNTVNIQGNHFTWRTAFNITVPKNELMAFPGLETSTFANRFIIGEPLTVLRLYHALGVNPETGIYEFEDYNGDGNISSVEDRQWLEDFAPEFYGGFGNTFSYKNISLDVFFQFKKQKAYNYFSFQAIPGYRRNAPVELLDRWQEEGDNHPIQKASAGLSGGLDTGQLQASSSAAVADASFIRLRNVSLNYHVPKHLSHGMDINLYLQGQNLLTITGYNGPDPEQPSYLILPPLRQITLGLQLVF